jgi:hypothetical protein
VVISEILERLDSAFYPSGALTGDLLFDVVRELVRENPDAVARDFGAYNDVATFAAIPEMLRLLLEGTDRISEEGLMMFWVGLSSSSFRAIPLRFRFCWERPSPGDLSCVALFGCDRCLFGEPVLAQRLAHVVSRRLRSVRIHVGNERSVEYRSR